ncbi:MAG: T9SS type A sorting domain-containing protein [Sporocytophaga sp.]|uniref:T9SS type A sorting domain-containing protein n=1 Tax=Sporocytophaga sp. TaxID=2231183 RepID=UPI001B11BD24|nr:T9SS type A sorting domain-containing protein [Sporocytophaga sp.]MBO9702050.1 T9SS type A sorting domain-containing protein [Sporocytophaga sp.]
MKKNIILFGLLITMVLFSAKAQVALETSSTQFIEVIKVDGVTKYQIVDRENKILRVYNFDHTIFDEIQIPLEAGSFIIRVSDYSSKLFDKDDEYEYFMGSQNLSTYKVTGTIFNKDGSEIIKMDSVDAIETFNTPYGPKMRTSFFQTNPGWIWTRIYSLGGTIQSSDNRIENVSENPYPNPAVTGITLPYYLTDSQGELYIYNSSGSLIKSVKVGPDFQEIVLDVSEMNPGIYTYKVVSSSGESQGKKFLVR